MHASTGTSFRSALRAGVCQALQHPHGHDLPEKCHLDTFATVYWDLSKLPNRTAQPPMSYVYIMYHVLFLRSLRQPKSVQPMNVSFWNLFGELGKTSSGSCIKTHVITFYTFIFLLNVVNPGNESESFSSNMASNQTTPTIMNQTVWPPIFGRGRNHSLSHREDNKSIATTNSPIRRKCPPAQCGWKIPSIHALMFFWHLVFAFIDSWSRQGGAATCYLVCMALLIMICNNRFLSSSKVELLLSAQVHCNYQSLKVSKHHKASATLSWVSRNTNRHPWDVWVLTTKSLKPVASSPSSAPTASCSPATNGGLLDHLRPSKIMPSRASSWAERVS